MNALEKNHLKSIAFLCKYCRFVVSTFRSFPHSRLITWFVTSLTRRVPLVEQEGTAFHSGAPEFTPGFQWGS